MKKQLLEACDKMDKLYKNTGFDSNKAMIRMLFELLPDDEPNMPPYSDIDQLCRVAHITKDLVPPTLVEVYCMGKDHRCEWEQDDKPPHNQCPVCLAFFGIDEAHVCEKAHTVYREQGVTLSTDLLKECVEKCEKNNVSHAQIAKEHKILNEQDDKENIDIRNEALEEAAKVAENIYTGEEAVGDWPTPEMVAKAIRELKEG